MRVESLDHIHIYAANPEESAGFYQLHFEAKQAHRNVNTKGDVRIFLALGGQIIVLGSFPMGMPSVTPPEAGDGAYVHGFGTPSVADLKASIDELSASGVRVISEVVQEPTGLSYAYVAAPDGVILELTQYESAV